MRARHSLAAGSVLSNLGSCLLRLVEGTIGGAMTPHHVADAPDQIASNVDVSRASPVGIHRSAR
eukprot:60777-Lingulodinium_polyedra.AAC.1